MNDAEKIIVEYKIMSTKKYLATSITDQLVNKNIFNSKMSGL